MKKRGRNKIPGHWSTACSDSTLPPVAVVPAALTTLLATRVVLFTADAAMAGVAGVLVPGVAGCEGTLEKTTVRAGGAFAPAGSSFPSTAGSKLSLLVEPAAATSSRAARSCVSATCAPCPCSPVNPDISVPAPEAQSSDGGSAQHASHTRSAHQTNYVPGSRTPQAWGCRYCARTQV